jgi:hypothetical protein
MDPEYIIDGNSIDTSQAVRRQEHPARQSVRKHARRHVPSHKTTRTKENVSAPADTEKRHTAIVVILLSILLAYAFVRTWYNK